MKTRGYYLKKNSETKAIEQEGVVILGKDEQEITYKITKGEEKRGSRFFRSLDLNKKYGKENI